MSSQSLVRAGAAALLLGCALVGVGASGDIAFSGAGQASNVVILMGWLAFVGVVFLNLGLPALYARYAGRAGVTGVIGYALVQIFFLLEIVDFFVAAVIRPFVVTNAPHARLPIGLFLAIFLVGPLLGVIGGIVFGIAMLRMGAQSRLPGILLIVAALALLGAGGLPQPGIGVSVFDVAVLLNLVAFVWLNFAVRATGVASAGATTPVAQPVQARG